MKLFPLHKAPFGYIRMLDEPLFPDCSIDYYEMTKRQVASGMFPEDLLNDVIPADERKLHNTQINLPAQNSNLVSPEQEKWLDYIVSHRNELVASVKKFLTQLRLSQEPVLDRDAPIEKCVEDPIVIIPGGEDQGLRLYFGCDWGEQQVVGVLFRGEAMIEECEVEMDRFFGEDLKD